MAREGKEAHRRKWEGIMARKDRAEQFLDPSTEAMLAEHERVAALYLYNAEIGEKRVSLYLTLVSGGTALFLGLAQFNLDSTLLLWPAAGFLSMVVLVGTLTFQRLIERRIRSTQYLRAINSIHCYFVQHDVSLWQYYSWPPCDNVPSLVGRAGVLAGLRDVVAVLNSLFAGGTIAVTGLALDNNHHYVIDAALGVAVAILAWFLQQRHEVRQLARAEDTSAQAVRFPWDGQMEQSLPGHEKSPEQ